MGCAARQRAEQLFDIRKNVAVLHGWFEEAALSSSARAAASAPAARQLA
jgi:hypothetical protein